MKRVVGVPGDPHVLLPARGRLVQQEAVVLLDDRDPVLLHAHPVLRVGAEVDHVLDAAGHGVVEAVVLRPLAPDAQLLRAQAEGDGPALADLLVVEAHDPGEAVDLEPAVVAGDDLGHLALEEVRVADEGRDEARARGLVDLGRRAHLLDAAVLHHRDAVREAHRLALVVGHVQERDPDLVVDEVELDQHALAQLEVERGERLVEQQHVGLVDEGARDRHPLLLASADLRRLLPRLGLELGEGEHAPDLLVDALPRPAGDARAEGDVLAHREVREEGVALEDRVDLAAVRRQRGDVLAVQEDAPGVGRLEAGQHAQQRRLAAAARPEQREELALLDPERDGVHGPQGAEALRDALELEEASHAAGYAGRARAYGRGA